MKSTGVQSRSKSSTAAIVPGKSLPHSELVAALLSTPTGKEFSAASKKKLLVLLALFKALLENTYGSDRILLSIYGAASMLEGHMDKEEACVMAEELIRSAKRRSSPLDSMF